MRRARVGVGAASGHSSWRSTPRHIKLVWALICVFNVVLVVLHLTSNFAIYSSPAPPPPPAEPARAVVAPTAPRAAELSRQKAMLDSSAPLHYWREEKNAESRSKTTTELTDPSLKALLDRPRGSAWSPGVRREERNVPQEWTTTCSSSEGSRDSSGDAAQEGTRSSMYVPRHSRVAAETAICWADVRTEPGCRALSVDLTQSRYQHWQWEKNMTDAGCAVTLVVAPGQQKFALPPFVQHVAYSSNFDWTTGFRGFRHVRATCQGCEFNLLRLLLDDARGLEGLKTLFVTFYRVMETRRGGAPALGAFEKEVARDLLRLFRASETHDPRWWWRGTEARAPIVEIGLRRG